MRLSKVNSKLRINDRKGIKVHGDISIGHNRCGLIVRVLLAWEQY